MSQLVTYETFLLRRLRQAQTRPPREPNGGPAQIIACPVPAPRSGSVQPAPRRAARRGRTVERAEREGR